MLETFFTRRSAPGRHSCAAGALFFAITGGSAGSSQDASIPPVPVTTVKQADVVFFPALTAPATVISLNNARVSAEINGLLREIPVKVGEEVREGAVIARIDCRDAEADLAQSEAAYKASQAQDEYDQSQHAKARKLLASNSISSEEIDKRKANALISSAKVDRARADLDKARLAVNRCELKAPFNAVVVERLASVGDFVNKGVPVIQLLEIDSTEISARVQEIDLDSVKNAQAWFFDSQNESYPVELRTVVPVMESRLRSYETRFTFTQKKAASGSAGRLRWISPQSQVPAEFLVRRGSGLGVFIESEGRAVFIELTGAQEGKPAPLSAGIKGDIIVDGRFNVNDGDPVQVNNP